MPMPSPVLPPRRTSTSSTSSLNSNQSSSRRPGKRRHRHHRQRVAQVRRHEQLSTIDEERSWENRSSLGNSEPSVISVSVNPEVVISSTSPAAENLRNFPPAPAQPPPYCTSSTSGSPSATNNTSAVPPPMTSGAPGPSASAPTSHCTCSSNTQRVSLLTSFQYLPPG